MERFENQSSDRNRINVSVYQQHQKDKDTLDQAAITTAIAAFKFLNNQFQLKLIDIQTKLKVLFKLIEQVSQSITFRQRNLICLHKSKRRLL